MCVCSVISAAFSPYYLQWGIAFWVIADQFAQFYDDDSFETAYYPHLKWYMDHWVDLATANAGIFPVASYGDWAEFCEL